MAKKTPLPPNQDQKKFIQDEDLGKENASDKAGRKRQQDQPNKGYSEDQPGHPVRTTGSMRPDQESDMSLRQTKTGPDRE